MSTCPLTIFPIGKSLLDREAIFPIGMKWPTTAGLVGVGARFLGELERGKPSVRLELVLKVLERLGLEVWISPRGWKP